MLCSIEGLGYLSKKGAVSRVQSAEKPECHYLLLLIQITLLHCGCSCSQPKIVKFYKLDNVFQFLTVQFVGNVKTAVW